MILLTAIGVAVALNLALTIGDTAFRSAGLY